MPPMHSESIGVEIAVGGSVEVFTSAEIGRVVIDNRAMPHVK